MVHDDVAYSSPTVSRVWLPKRFVNQFSNCILKLAQMVVPFVKAMLAYVALYPRLLPSRFSAWGGAWV